MKSMARGVLALLTGLLLAAGLLSATSAPASAGQVGVTIQIKGAGSVQVVEGSLEDGGARSCVMDDNQNHHVTVSCPRIRNSEAFEAWVWLRATPSSYPAGNWRFENWGGCDRIRINAGHEECGVHSGAFSSDERYPVAMFLDNVAPALSGLEVQQVLGVDRRFRVSFAASDDGVTQCQVAGVTSYAPCSSGDVLAVPGGTYDVRVRNVDPSGNETTASQRVISVDTSFVRLPERLSRDDTADFRFSTDGGAAFWCSVDGAPYAACGTGPTADHTLAPLPDGPHTISVRASNGDWVDPVPVMWSWTIDTVAPTSTVAADVDGTSASFQLDHSEPASAECRLDTPAGPGAWESCSSPVSYTGLDQGEHQLWVRARDDAGNLQVVPVSHRWTVDTIAPTTNLDSSTADDRASFSFSAPEDTSFECRLTSPSGPGSWAGCSSPTTYAGLVPGSHRFEVRATDAAGNVEQVPATHAWVATAPVTVPQTPGTQTPGTQTPGTSTPGTQTPTTPEPSPTRVTSTTSAKWKVSAARRGKVFVKVSSVVAATGTVTVKDRGRTIARATLAVSHQGRIVVRIPRLSRGKHVLVVHYGGSATTVGSSSAKRIVTLR